MPKRQNDELAENLQTALADELISEEGGDLLRRSYGDPWPVVASVESFEEAGVMTRGKGLLVSMSDGSQVELTIVAYSQD